MFTSQEVAKIVAELRAGIGLLFPQNNIETILFGSYARGDADSGSDIDVLFLVDESRQDISSLNWKVGNIAAEFFAGLRHCSIPYCGKQGVFNANLHLFPFYRNNDSEGVRISA